VPHVDQLVGKFGKRGFSAIYLTDGPEAPTKKFVEETKLKAPVVFEKSMKEPMEDLGFGGYPSSALVGPDGKIIWTGHPGNLDEKTIEENLANVKLAPPSDKLMIDCDLPAKQASIEKLLSTGKIAEGRNALAKALTAKDLKDEDKTKLEAAQSEVDKTLDDELKAAEKAQTDKHYFDAQTGWKRLSTQCKGLDAAKTADQKLSELQELAKDPAVKKELDAGSRIAEAHKLAAAGKTKQAIGVLTSLGDGYLKDTEEAKRAKELAEALKKE
jgi:hypothetical protein